MRSLPIAAASSFKKSSLRTDSPATGALFHAAEPIITFSAIREKMAYSKVPAPLKGLGITFMVVGLMGMAFMTFMGISL